MLELVLVPISTTFPGSFSPSVSAYYLLKMRLYLSLLVLGGGGRLQIGGSLSISWIRVAL